MTLVVDASVIVAALVDNGPRGVWAEEVLSEGWLNAPELIFVEVANVLRRLERARKISSAQAASAIEDLTNLPIESFPFEPFAERIWELRAAVTSYDAWYIALAEALGAPLATLDVKLTRAKGVRCRFQAARIVS